MELFVTIVNKLLIVNYFCKTLHLRCLRKSGCPGYAPICRPYATKVSILDVLLDPKSAYVTDNDPPFQNSYSPYKVLASATSALVYLSKIPKHKVTWSKNSILVVTVALDSGPFKFA